MKALRQPVLVLMLVVEGAAHGRKRLGKRKDLGTDQKVAVLSADRMPEHAVGPDRHLGNQISPCQGDAFSGGAAQGNAPDHPVLIPDVMRVKEAGKLLIFLVARHRRGQPDAKAFDACELDSLPGSIPRSRSAMRVMSIGRRTIEADL